MFPNGGSTTPSDAAKRVLSSATRFRTKCELAGRMLERIWQAQISISWIVADCVYGSNATLRAWLQAHRYFYVMAVRCTEPIEIQTPTGRMQMTVAEAEARFIQAQDWQRLSMGEGTKGPRWFDWVCLPMLHQCEDDGRDFLLIRRLPTDPSKKTYSFSHRTSFGNVPRERNAASRLLIPMLNLKETLRS